MINANCTLCGNRSSFDKETLKESTITINGAKVVMCIDCEEEMFKKLTQRHSKQTGGKA